MLASLSGSLALAVGLAVMLLPLLCPELSRPRDAAWGAVALVLGLTLVTGADRLTGSPMLAVLCGGLLMGRLGNEVIQLRWRQLTPEEQQRLVSRERWQASGTELATSVGVLGSSLGRNGSIFAASMASLTAALRGRSGGGNSSGKRWVRPEPSSSEPETPADTQVGQSDTAPSAASTHQPDTVVVRSFAEIDALIEAASDEAG